MIAVAATPDATSMMTLEEFHEKWDDITWESRWVRDDGTRITIYNARGDGGNMWYVVTAFREDGDEARMMQAANEELALGSIYTRGE